MAQAPTALVAQPGVQTDRNRVTLPFLRIQERRFLLAAVDACIVTLVMSGAYDIWRARVHPAADNMSTTPWAWVVAGAALWLLVTWLASGYDLEVADRFSRSLRSTLTVTGIVATVGVAGDWLFLKTYPRPALALAIVAAPAATLVWRAGYGLLLRRPVGATTTLVIGNERQFQFLSTAAETSEYFDVIGFVGEAESGTQGWFGPAELVDRLAVASGVHRIVVAPKMVLSDSVMASLTSAIERGIEVIDFNSAYEEMAEKVAVEHAGDHWLTALPTRPRTGSIQEGIIRLVDIVGSVAGLVVTGLLTPVIAGAIVITSGRPVLYRQQRLGRGGKPFSIIKFRSMRRDAESDGERWATAGDNRATRVGTILRSTHLDELPQFWNVLKGEMSLVGPRPERPQFTDALSREIPFYRLRLSVRPGLTGLKQLRIGYAASTEEHLEVLRHDLYYVKHRSLSLNILVMARTLGAVIGRNGR